MASPPRPAKGRKTFKRGPRQRIVEGRSFRLADEVRYIQRRAAEHDSRIVTIAQLVLFSTQTGDTWLLDSTDRLAAPSCPCRPAVSSLEAYQTPAHRARRTAKSRAGV